MERSNEQVATGKLYTRPSQNQSAAARAAVLRDQLDQLATFGRAVNDARSRLALADSKTQQAMDLYHRVTELTTQAATSTTGPAARLSIASEIGQLRSELEAIANTQYLDSSLFSGFQSGAAVAYDVGSGSWQFYGTASERIQRRIGPSEVVDSNITAGELFSNGTTDIFSVLDDLTAALTADNTPAIQAVLADVSDLRRTLLAGQTKLGAVLNRVEQAAGRNSSIEVMTNAEISSVEDVDLADAITDQNRLLLAYQAALGVTAKANEQTLLDWWR
jgi:flagellar hook-associated protein 3 FlgL